MFRNVLAASLRHLIGNRLYAAINTFGLALGFAAAMLTALYIHDELTFDRFIPGYSNVYVLTTDMRLPGRKTLVTDEAPLSAGSQLKLDFKEVQSFARLLPQSLGVQNGDVSATETIGWADPDLFSILPLPLLAGDLGTALSKPDGAVITRAMARKYFGQDAPIGQFLDLNRTNRVQVRAVLDDLPGNTHLAQQIFVSGLNASSFLRQFDGPEPRGSFGVAGRTYLRFGDTAAADRVNAGLADFLTRRFSLPDGKLISGMTASFKLVPLASLHLYPLQGTTIGNTNGHANPATLAALGLIAALILVVAGINFVNLMTALASRRAVEIGVRKVSGAQRTDLIVQFIGEALVYALISLFVAISATELILPILRNLLDRPLDFAFWDNPVLLLLALLMAAVVGVLAGIYPALIQSGFRPALVIKGGHPLTAGSGAVRSCLATVQFAFLIGLILAVIVIGLQTRYALNEGLRVDKNETVLVDVSRPFAPNTPPQCRDAFPDQVRRLPGVRAAACSSSVALDMADSEITVGMPNGGSQGVGLAFVDYGFLELYGLRPVAGRFFSRDHPGDETSLKQPPPFPPKVAVINEKAVRALGFGSAAQAVGKSFRAVYGPVTVPVQIIGVAPDFAFDLIQGGQRPMVYATMPLAYDTLSVKLNGQNIPETLRQIGRLWQSSGAARPVSYRFVDTYLQALYGSTIRQGYIVDALCGVAVFIGCLGLLGLVVHSAERRNKEIGLRKVMGASRLDIVCLLLWQFSKPILWANLIAWPVAWWALEHWLKTFARRIDLNPALFLSASMIALAIGWATVFFHTVRISNAKPVKALRYE